MISVAQLGARMHYAVPRIFSRAGMLDKLYTDFWMPKLCADLLRIIPSQAIPRPVRRMISRTPQDLPRIHIQAYNTLGVRYAWLLSHAKSDDERTKVHFQIGDQFSKRILAQEKPKPQMMYVFDSASLNLMQSWKRDVRFIMEQTNAPRAVMMKILREEHERHPGWSTEEPSTDLENLIMDRYHEAWSLADTIVTGSDFVRAGMQQCGAPHEKCKVVPYGVDLPASTLQENYQDVLIEKRLKRRQDGGPLHVLTVGSVCLRKGAPYIMQAAKHLQNKAEFKLAGSINLTNEARQQMMQHTSLLGLIPRQEMQALYEWADVFLLPSVCEGSATVTYEALAYGLPVICTPNTGSVVRNRHDGLIVEPSSGEAVIQALETILDEPDLWERLSRNAFDTSRQMSVACYGKRLLKAIEPIKIHQPQK